MTYKRLTVTVAITDEDLAVVYEELRRENQSHAPIRFEAVISLMICRGVRETAKLHRLLSVAETYQEETRHER